MLTPVALQEARELQKSILLSTRLRRSEAPAAATISATSHMQRCGVRKYLAIELQIFALLQDGDAVLADRAGEQQDVSWPHLPAGKLQPPGTRIAPKPSSKAGTHSTSP